MQQVKHLGKETFKKLIMNQALEKKVIREAVIEITDSCNYKCRYCYVHNTYRKHIELEAFKKIINQLVKKGCLWLTITGGEPLSHSKFQSIYEYAYDSGMKVTVFTNGSLINQSICELFQRKPPYEIELTLYGVDKNTYEGITQVDNSFYYFEKALTELKKKGISFKVKWTLTKENYKINDKFIEYCDRKHLAFRYDNFILPGLTKEVDLNKYRLSPQEAFISTLQQKEYMENLIESFDGSISNLLYSCGAGINSVFIDANSNVSRCIISRKEQYNLNQYSMEAIHNEFIRKSYIELSEEDKCYNCPKRSICRYCPSRFELETDSERVPSAWYCEYGEMMYDYILSCQNK